jgi:hypothetical protein
VLKDHSPYTLYYRHRSRRVSQVLDQWRYAGKWWEGAAARHYYLLQLEGGLLAEVYCEQEAVSIGEMRWVLSRTSD